MPLKARLRVLCVDDDEDSRVMLTTLLKLALIDAKAVGTGAQALSSIQTERFDPDTPILFFSGAAYEADKKKGIEAGANAYVIKPDVDGLVSSVKQFVSQAERRSQAERPTARIIPFVRKTRRPSPFTFEPAAA